MIPHLSKWMFTTLTWFLMGHECEAQSCPLQLKQTPSIWVISNGKETFLSSVLIIENLIAKLLNVKPVPKSPNIARKEKLVRCGSTCMYAKDIGIWACLMVNSTIHVALHKKKTRYMSRENKTIIYVYRLNKGMHLTFEAPSKLKKIAYHRHFIFKKFWKLKKISLIKSEQHKNYWTSEQVKLKLYKMSNAFNCDKKKHTITQLQNGATNL